MSKRMSQVAETAQVRRQRIRQDQNFRRALIAVIQKDGEQTAASVIATRRTVKRRRAKMRGRRSRSRGSADRALRRYRTG